jgi:hypothetical protein
MNLQDRIVEIISDYHNEPYDLSIEDTAKAILALVEEVHEKHCKEQYDLGHAHGVEIERATTAHPTVSEQCCDTCKRVYAVAEVYKNDPSKGWYCLNRTCPCHSPSSGVDNRPEAVLDRVLRKTGVIPEPYSRRDHTHCWNQTSSPCGIPLEKHTQCCLCDTLVEPTAPVGGSWEGEFVEKGAALEHERWAKWHKYMIDKQTPENLERWARQSVTPYALLSESEKESDRREVRTYLPLVRQTIKNHDREIAEGVEALKIITQSTDYESTKTSIENAGYNQALDDVLAFINKQ